MRGYFGITDIDWFRFLRAGQPHDEVNFWQPSAHGFNAPPGTPFFFKLKSPHNAIGGFGWFARYSTATPRLAWEAFGTKNGSATFAEMRARIAGYSQSPPSPLHQVGCIMISTPVFFDDGDWIEQPSDWKRNVVSGAGYDVSAGEGRRVFEGCLARLRARRGPSWWPGAEEATPLGKHGPPQPVRPRLGQASFRIAVTSAYQGACTITGEHSLPALEAAHIRPFSDPGSTHDVTNGLLLRADVHRLFDRGYVTFDPDGRFVVSRKLKEEFENGRVYYALEGRRLAAPAAPGDRPDPAALRWHNENVFERTAA